MGNRKPWWNLQKGEAKTEVSCAGPVPDTSLQLPDTAEDSVAQKDQPYPKPLLSCGWFPTWPWEKYTTSLGLNFHICKLGMIVKGMNLVRQEGHTCSHLSPTTLGVAGQATLRARMVRLNRAAGQVSARTPTQKPSMRFPHIHIHLPTEAITATVLSPADLDVGQPWSWDAWTAPVYSHSLFVSRPRSHLHPYPHSYTASCLLLCTRRCLSPDGCCLLCVCTGPCACVLRGHTCVHA
jgi:hypothetical protein